jgi:hypothetical protein
MIRRIMIKASPDKNVSGTPFEPMAGHSDVYMSPQILQEA